MDLLRGCAAALDAGADTAEVMAKLRARYTTVRCLSTKTCLVRQLCTPTPEYRAAVAALLPEVRAEDPALADALERALPTGKAGGDPRVAALLARLPHRLAANAYALRVTRAESRECKALAFRGTLEKNRVRRRVDGRLLLHEARARIGLITTNTASSSSSLSVADLALALMLLTGRRTCEVLNGTSEFTVEAPYALHFGGQAKRRGQGGSYVVPTLAPAACVARAWERLRALQHGAQLTNKATSRRYQGALSRRLDATWPRVECVHGLRGVYACMALRLFEWGDASDAFVAMSILGHRGLHESLVYTPFALGDDFHTEPGLGVGHFTPPPPPAHAATSEGA